MCLQGRLGFNLITSTQDNSGWARSAGSTPPGSIEGDGKAKTRGQVWIIRIRIVLELKSLELELN